MKNFRNNNRRAIKTNTIDEYKKDSKHLRAFVMDTGELFDDFKHIKKNHYYKKREIEKLLKQQESLKINTIKYYLVSIVDKIKEANHNLIDRKICKDNKDEIVLILKEWLKNEKIDAIITTGGTGLTGRDRDSRC